jgi:nucleoside-diphosphate-sugar epimerase
MKQALVCGAGGFIGSHLVKRLKREGFWVRGVDLKYAEFSKTAADDFVIGDLRDPVLCRRVTDRPFDEVYQLAADMGAGDASFQPAPRGPVGWETRRDKRAIFRVKKAF